MTDLSKDHDTYVQLSLAQVKFLRTLIDNAQSPTIRVGPNDDAEENLQMARVVAIRDAVTGWNQTFERFGLNLQIK